MSLKDALVQHAKTTKDVQFGRAIQGFNLNDAKGREMFWGYMVINKVKSYGPDLSKILLDHDKELRGKQKSSSEIRRDVKGLNLDKADDRQRLHGIVNMYGYHEEASNILDALTKKGIQAAKELQKKL